MDAVPTFGLLADTDSWRVATSWWTANEPSGAETTREPGALGQLGTYEKNVVLPIAAELRQLIRGQAGMRAFMTREGDYFVPLRQRVEKVRRVSADLFVSDGSRYEDLGVNFRRVVDDLWRRAKPDPNLRTLKL